MDNKNLILFCSSGKTFGHFLKNHALYKGTLQKYNAIEVINPTQFAKPFLTNEQILNSDLYFTNNSFTNTEQLEKNIADLGIFLKEYKPTLVISDKLPNLMTTCVKNNIPYISITHSTQISHNLGVLENPNLKLFNDIWQKYNLKKPVSDESWFFYRNWGNVVVFSDDYTEESKKLDDFGYTYTFTGNIPVDVGDTQNHVLKIRTKFLKNKFLTIAFFSMSSYASKESDDLVINLARTNHIVLIIYTRLETEYIDEQIARYNLHNVYVTPYIDYSIIKALVKLVICLPGNGTLNSFKDFKYPIVSFYVHPEQANNAANYKHKNFTYFKLGITSYMICDEALKNIEPIKNIDNEIANIQLPNHTPIAKFVELLDNVLI